MAKYEKEAYQYCMICGGDFLTKSDIEKECLNCGYAYYISPNPSASALILNERGQLLLIKRKRNPQQGTWDIPAGFLDNNETVEIALKREIEEEVGIKITNYSFYKSIIVEYEYKGIIKKVVNSVFIVKLENESEVKAGDDAESYKFVDLDNFNLDEVGFPEVKKLLREFKGFKLTN